jgi:uncharacterized membrane protein YedE/YeeE
MERTRKERKNEMNIFEALFFLLALALSILFGKYFVRQIGWWGVVPAGLLGFGLVAVFLSFAKKSFARRGRAMGRK